MNLPMGQVLKDFRDEVLKDPTGQDLTLRYVAVEALVANYPDLQDGVTKVRRYELAARIHRGNATLTVEEVAELKQLVGRAFGPLIVGAAFPLLEGTQA